MCLLFVVQFSVFGLKKFKRKWLSERPACILDPRAETAVPGVSGKTPLSDAATSGSASTGTLFHFPPIVTSCHWKGGGLLRADISVSSTVVPCMKHFLPAIENLHFGSTQIYITMLLYKYIPLFFLVGWFGQFINKDFNVSQFHPAKQSRSSLPVKKRQRTESDLN